MKATLTYQGGAEGISWLTESESGHQIMIDGSPDVGGQDKGARPMELILIGTAGCTAMDVLSILRKKRQKVQDCVITIEGERAEGYPKVFTKMHVHFKVIGEGVEPRAVERAIELSHTKYCSAYAMMSATAEMSSSFEIVEVAQAN